MHVELVPRAKHGGAVLAVVLIAVGKVNVLDVFAHVAPVPGRLAAEHAAVEGDPVHHLLGQVAVQRHRTIYNIHTEFQGRNTCLGIIKTFSKI